MENRSYILLLNQQILKRIYIFSFLVSVVSSSLAQKQNTSGLNFGAKIGASTLLSEIPYDFSKTINEFDNKAGLAYSFEVSKYISTRWELGFEWNFSNLRGSTYSPEFSAEGIQAGIPAEITEPVEYNNNLNGPSIFFRYYFKPVTEEVYFNPFIRLGIGLLHYKSTFSYIDTEEVIFGTDKVGSNVNTPVLNLGTGFKTSLSPRAYLVTSIDFNMVNYDFLDVVHNFDAEGNRQKLFGLYLEFKVGIFYNILLKTKKKSKSKYSATGFMPFGRY